MTIEEILGKLDIKPAYEWFDHSYKGLENLKKYHELITDNNIIKYENGFVPIPSNLKEFFKVFHTASDIIYREKDENIMYFKIQCDNNMFLIENSKAAIKAYDRKEKIKRILNAG